MISHDEVPVYFCLLEDGMIRDDTTIRPKEATEEDLRVVHTKRYINSLRVSISLSRIYKLYLLIFHHDYVFVSHIRRKPIYTPGIYAEGYIVFVFPFVRLYVRSFLLP